MTLIAGKTVLLIEDDAEIAAHLEASLPEHGFKVTVIRNGEEAMATALKLRPDLRMCGRICIKKLKINFCRAMAGQLSESNRSKKNSGL